MAGRSEHAAPNQTLGGCEVERHEGREDEARFGFRQGTASQPGGNARRLEGSAVASLRDAMADNLRLEPERRLGWVTGFEPATSGSTIRRSTPELHPPQRENSIIR